ncbi:MAG: M56 family metallopeptidase [Pseudomonadota bacterium]
MSFFTVAYLARLEVWGLAAVCLQGALVMLSWFGWERVTRRSSPATRHRLACIHLAALAVLPAITVMVLHWTVSRMGIAPPHGSPVAELARQMAGYRSFLALALPLAGVWMVGGLAMLLRLVREARQLARLHCRPAPAGLRRAVHRLARGHMGMAMPDVKLAQVASPQVVGLWRAVVLVPETLVHLPQAECDALLLHELAHVKQRDFRWNLLQRIALAALWFHPAAWMLYRRVMREREMRCDAQALRHGAAPLALARGLIRLAEHRAPAALAMAVTGDGDFVARIHRLLGVDAVPGTPAAGARPVALALSALCLLALAGGRLGRTDTSMADLYHASSFGPTVSVLAHDDAGSFALRIRRGQVLAATVGQQALARDRIRQHGDRVTLLDAAQQPILALTVTPQDRIEWDGRP